MTNRIRRRQLLRLGLGAGVFAGVQATVPQFVLSSDRPAHSPQLRSPQLPRTKGLTPERFPLRVGISPDRRPLSFMAEAGQRVGLEITLARALALTLAGFEVSGLDGVEQRHPASDWPELTELIAFIPLTNPDRLAAVMSGQVDFAIAGITATDVRRRLVHFSLPYYLDGTTFITRNPHLRSRRDIAQQEIAILAGSSAIATVRAQIPVARLRGVNSYAAAQAWLNANPQAVFAGDASVLAGWAQLDDRYRVGPRLLSVEPLAIALPKGLQHTELQVQVNRAIEHWTETGWLRVQLQQWQLP